MNRLSTNRGLVRAIILIVVALLILSYFGFNLRALINSPTTQDNFSYTWQFVVGVWNNYLKVPATFIWNLIWTLIRPGLEKVVAPALTTQPHP